MRRFLALLIVLVLSTAVHAQERLGDKTVEEWTKRLQDPKSENRLRDLQQIRSLTTIKGNPNSLYPVLLDLLKDPDVQVRTAASVILGNTIMDPATEPAIKERLKDPELRVRAAIGLLRLDRMHPEGVAVWLEAVGNPKEKYRLQALNLFPDFNPPKGAAELFLKIIKEDDAEFRFQVFRVLPRYGTIALPALREGVRDPVVTVKVQALTSLVSLRDRSAVDTLVEAVTDRDLRKQAINGLMMFPPLPESATPAILSAFKDATADEKSRLTFMMLPGDVGPMFIREAMKGKDTTLQLDLVEALSARSATLTEPMIQALRQILEAPQAEGRLKALRMLTRPEGKLTAKDFEKLVGDSYFRIRLLAAEQLAKREDLDPEPLVAMLLDIAAKDPDLAVREETAQALRLMERRSMSVLLFDLSSKDRATREKAALGIELIGRAAGAYADQLVRSLKDESPFVRRTIGVTLLRMGGVGEGALRKALGEKDDALRRAALEALVILDSPPPGTLRFPRPRPSVAELEPMLKHDDASVRVRAASLLANTRPKEAEAALSEALESKDVALRRAAAGCLHLATGGDPIGAPALSTPIAKAVRDDDVGVRLYANAALGRGTPANVLCESLKVEDEAIRALALRLLARQPWDAVDAAARLAELLRDRDAVVRKYAAHIFSEIGPAKAAAALKPLLETAKEQSPLLRQFGLHALGWTGAKEAVPVLIAALEDDELNVRIAALEALGNLGTSAGPAIPALVKLLEHDRPLVDPMLPVVPRFKFPGTAPPIVDPFARPRRPASSSAMVADALAKIGPAPEAGVAIPVLARRLQAGQVEVARVLGLLGATAVPTLLEGLKKDETRVASIMALGSVGPAAKDAAAPLAALLKDDNAEVRLQAAFALAQLGPAAKQALPDLLPIIDDAKAALDLRLTAINAVGGIGPDAAAARPVLQKLLKEPRVTLRVASIRALGLVGLDETTRPLIEELRMDASTLVQQAARDALKVEKK